MATTTPGWKGADRVFHRLVTVKLLYLRYSHLPKWQPRREISPLHSSPRALRRCRAGPTFAPVLRFTSRLLDIPRCGVLASCISMTKGWARVQVWVSAAVTFSLLARTSCSIGHDR